MSEDPWALQFFQLREHGLQVSMDHLSHCHTSIKGTENADKPNELEETVNHVAHFSDVHFDP